MLVGDFAGKKVSEAKELVRAELLAKGDAAVYYEPENRVVSRSGEECVVAFCDQWYLNYADEAWKSVVKEHIAKTLKCNSEVVHKEFAHTVDWIHEWGCSRSFGLGT